jgi:hypothetical protein
LVGAGCYTARSPRVRKQFGFTVEHGEASRIRVVTGSVQPRGAMVRTV